MKNLQQRSLQHGAATSKSHCVFNMNYRSKRGNKELTPESPVRKRSRAMETSTPVSKPCQYRDPQVVMVSPIKATGETSSCSSGGDRDLIGVSLGIH